MASPNKGPLVGEGGDSRYHGSQSRIVGLTNPFPPLPESFWNFADLTADKAFLARVLRIGSHDAMGAVCPVASPARLAYLYKMLSPKGMELRVGAI
jgi:hypothetical protein